jgi:hypothetical protein
MTEAEDVLLRGSGYFPWGVGLWMHEDDPGVALSSADALAQALNLCQLLTAVACGMTPVFAQGATTSESCTAKLLRRAQYLATCSQEE